MNLFEFDSVSVSFNGTALLRNFSLSIREGEKVVIAGPSGTGKSTLLRMLLGFVRPDRGTVRFRGVPLNAPLAWRLRKETAYVNQSVAFEVGTAREAIESLFHWKASPEQPAPESVADALERVGLTASTLDQSVSELSGGEKQRLALAGVLLLGRSIFLLDEPGASLDGDTGSRIAELFLEGPPEWTVIAVAHHEAWIRNRDDVTVVDLGPSRQTT